MGSNPNPVSVYPDPDGAKSNAYTPVNTTTQVASIVLGAVGVGAAAAGSGTVSGPGFLFLQAGQRGVGFLGFHAASGTYVAIAVIFGALSVLLSVINLVNGLRMKERLRELSDRVSAACAKEGVFDWWKTKRAA
jgi:hypothetical protein